MNQTISSLNKSQLTPESATFGLVMLSLAVGLAAVSGESYWIDEITTMQKAMKPTLSGWWQELRAESTSNIQMPLYMLYAWVWTKFAGMGEWAMRAANVPLFAFAVMALSPAFAGPKLARARAAVVALASAFAWYYVSEARPYAMQLALGCLVFVALCRLAGQEEMTPERERRWAICLAVGAVALAASGMLAQLWLGAGLGAALLTFGGARLRELWARHRGLWLMMAAGLLAMGCFYLWTLSVGARATDVGTSDPRNLLFISYELTGFSGLGPGRLAIRSEGLRAFMPYLPALAVYGALVAALLWFGWLRLLSMASRRTLICVAVCLAGVTAFLMVVGAAIRFRVLGRHFAPVAVIALFLLGLGLSALWERRGWLGKAVVAAFAVTSLWSCLSVRLAERHARDDYRQAVAVAKAALSKGERVWWNADGGAMPVYDLAAEEPPGVAGRAVLVDQPKPGFTNGIEPPDVVLVSKPDIYDRSGAVAEYLTTSGYRPVAQLVAFTVWRRGE
jgi:hypothetical protein